MEIGIVGLPKSGKTTIFNALTRGRAQVSAHAASRDANIGVAKVPDERLQALARIFQPQKVVPAEIKYVDVAAAPKGFGKGEGISGVFLNQLSRADALVQVIRAFPDDNVPHIENSIDPKRDIAILGLELAFSDLAIIERRLQKLESSLKAAKGSERDPYLREQELLNRIKSGLESEVPVYRQPLSPEEIKALSVYQFLTAKPTLVVLNIGESQLEQAAALESEIRALYPYPQFAIVALCGKLEMELAEMSDEDAEVFRRDLKLGEAALARMVKLSYDLLGLISFLTVGADEVRAWSIARGTTAVKAAGKIHSDLERGFIRAEVIPFTQLMECGSMAEARRRGLLRLEGKSYIVQDGDVVTILFNV
jgi:GTP-binding protein YchF